MSTYLVVGSGGREHALAWKLASESGAEVIVAPGSDGIATTAGVRCVDVAVDDLEGLVSIAREFRVDLTVVGPEAPLVAGIGDRFRSLGLPLLGPDAAAAQLEGSKAFAKDVMRAANVPTADYRTFHAASDAHAYIDELRRPVVVKADGLAAGKGVVVCQDAADAHAAVDAIMVARRFGSAGAAVLIEERLEGPEVSFMVVTDGKTIVPLSTSRDHKRLGDGDVGPNTGGMGAITPAPDLPDDFERRAVDSIIRPTLAELEARGIAYRGFLYAGLMLTTDGPRVLEFNVRLGDPETQALLFAMEQPLGPTLAAAAAGTLEPNSLSTNRCACTVVLASAGYPLTSSKGDVIFGLDDHERVDVHDFHSGTARTDGRWVTAGGRVLTITARGADSQSAHDTAYARVARVTWDGRQHRSDIGLA